MKRNGGCQFHGFRLKASQIRPGSILDKNAMLQIRPKELSGGSTMLLGISDQLTKGLRAKGHNGIRITVDSARDRKCSEAGDSPRRWEKLLGFHARLQDFLLIYNISQEFVAATEKEPHQFHYLMIGHSFNGVTGQNGLGLLQPVLELVVAYPKELSSTTKGFSSSVTSDYIPFQTWDLLQAKALHRLANRLIQHTVALHRQAQALNWKAKSRILMYIQGKEHGRMIHDSVLKGPLIWHTIEENCTTRDKTYEELSEKEKIQAGCDLKATDIVLQGLPYYVYSLINHHKVAKEIWDSVRLVMNGTEFSQQECECKMYNEFDSYPTPSVPQNALVPQNAYHSPLISQKPQANFPQLDSGLNVPSFLPGDDPIACLNKLVAFMSTVMLSRFPLTNNQLRTSSNLRNQATIQDGRVIVQQVQGRQGQSFTGTRTKENATSLGGNNAAASEAKEFCMVQGKDVACLGTGILSDCDDISSVKVFLMANLSRYDSDILSVVPNSDTYQTNDMINQSVQEMKYFEQTPIDDYPNNETTSDSNIISYSQNMHETQNAVVQEMNSSTPQDDIIMSMFEQMSNQVTNRDKDVKVIITPTTITEGRWGFEHTKKVFLEEVIPFLNSLREPVKDFDNGLHNKINEVKTVFNQMEAAVEQCFVDKKYFDIQKKELFLKNDQLLEHIISQDVMNIVMHVDSVTVNVLPANNKSLVNDNLEIERLKQENNHLFELLLSQDIIHICVNSLATRTNFCEMQKSFINEYNETLDLKAQLAKKEHDPEIQEFFHINKWQAKLKAKDVSIANLRKHIESLKGKNVIENDVSPNTTNVIAPGMFRLDLEPLAPGVLKNKDAYI
uniref:Uncharacterized protein n=1 Tax=Tanacetum cinerariifolium TaxID=118510 RepID=A0A6L2KZ92_TANCI|nr:hypothetical protein [Tanacetum cinerariifolium]